MTRPSQRRLLADKTGATAVILGISATAVLGAAGLAIDLGVWYADRRAAQGAADSAAYSAAYDYSAGDTAANVTATAKAVAAQYGLTDGSGGVTVSVNMPPTAGTHQTTAGAVEIVIRKTESPFFSSLFMNTASVAARAVAVAGSNSSASGKYCVLALDSSAATSVSTSGVIATNGVKIDLSACGLQINASGSDALYLSGGAKLTAGTVSIVGNYTVNNGAQLQISGALTTSASTMTDPYGAVAVPTTGACASTNSWGGGGNYTINPGTYCNGMTFNNGASVTMNPGVYIVDRGAFTLTGGSTLNATGVTIVLTSSSGSNYPSVTIDGGTSLNITAPTIGATKGLAFMEDRAAPASVSVNFAGGTSTTVQGALYFPSQVVSFTNGSNSTVCLQLIAYRISYTGGAKFQDSCSGFGTTEIGSSTSATALVE